ncbi:MAG: hypothetical protein ACYDAA_05710 [Syntrophales bacterium]
MSRLFLDVLGTGKLVDGYQIEDSIAQKYNLQPGTICPFTGLRVEILSPRQIREALRKAERRKKIEQQKETLEKEKRIRESEFARKKKKLSAVDRKISGRTADKKTTKKSIKQPDESHDFARGRARSDRGPATRSRIIKKEEVRMATVKKVPAKPAKAAAKAPAKTKSPAKTPAKAKAKAPAKAKAVAKKPAKTKAKAAAKTPVKAKIKTKAKAPAKAKVKAKAKAPAKAKAVAKKPAKAKK